MKSRWLTLIPALALAACSHMGGSKNESTSQTSKAQTQASSAFHKAADAQKQANDEQAKAEQAQQEVTASQKALAEAQAKAQGQQAKAEQAQQQAQQLDQQAQQEAQSSQQQALQFQKSEADMHQTLHQENQQSWSQARNINGKVFQASSDSVKVRASDRDMNLKLSDSTAISVDGRPSSAKQIQPGSEGRASYQMVDGQAQALKIDVKSNQGSSSSDSGSSGSSRSYGSGSSSDQGSTSNQNSTGSSATQQR